jgi:hypothetical protein
MRAGRATPAHGSRAALDDLDDERTFTLRRPSLGLFCRTIGLVRAKAKLTLANLAHNMDRLIFHERGGFTG